MYHKNRHVSTLRFTSEAVVQRYSVKKTFLEISQIHRQTPVPESRVFNKVRC